MTSVQCGGCGKHMSLDYASGGGDPCTFDISAWRMCAGCWNVMCFKLYGGPKHIRIGIWQNWLASKVSLDPHDKPAEDGPHASVDWFHNFNKEGF